MSYFVGQTIAISKGKQVNRNGVATRQKRDTVVTVTRTQADRRGKTRVFWKSGGYEASALVTI